MHTSKFTQMRKAWHINEPFCSSAGSKRHRSTKSPAKSRQQQDKPHCNKTNRIATGTTPHFNTLQHAATHRVTPHHTATCRIATQSPRHATHPNRPAHAQGPRVPQIDADAQGTTLQQSLQHTTTRCNTLQPGALARFFWLTRNP